MAKICYLFTLKIKQAAKTCRETAVCPPMCICTDSLVDCKDRGLTHIPANLPASTKIYLSSKIHIRKLLRTVFYKISLLRMLLIVLFFNIIFGLKVVFRRLGGNQITYIPPRIFQHHHLLLDLDLSSNSIAEIAPDAFQGLGSLKSLILYKNNITEIHQNTFRGLKNLTMLLLNSNRLRCVWKETFKDLRNLTLLSLFQNEVRSIAEGTFDNLPHLHTVHLGKNPLICDCNLVSFRNLINKVPFFFLISGIGLTEFPTEVPSFATELRLSNNQITVIQVISKQNKRQSAKNFRVQGIFYLSANEEGVCGDNGNYCPVDCHCQESVVKCERKGLFEFPAGIPSDTTHLSLIHNQISVIPKREINRLHNLVKLELSYNRIAAIESETFVNLKKLEMLLLNDNKIQCLEERAFAGLNNLKILSLYRNDISILPESAFKDLISLKNIVMLNNSLYCDCRMAWFSRWLNQNYLDWGMLKCDLPVNMRNQVLLSAQEHQFVCNDKIPQSILAKCNPCLEQPCKNRGTCISGKGRAFTCECKAGYHGEKCEDEIDACYGQPCLNNATCTGLQYGRFQCHCTKGFEGERCEINTDDCVEHRCRNGGTCVDEINAYRCKCLLGFGGEFCERKLEFCTMELNPCQNGGSCVRVNDTYKCYCPAGYTDENCTTNINDCQNHTCMNNAICIDGVNSYICKCSAGYSGKFCELAPISHYLYQKISPCQAQICNHGTCVEQGDDITCHCIEGYKGPRCDQLRAAGFVDPDSFIELEPWDTVPGGNLTLTVRTYAKTGVIAYYGVESHFTAELFDGRIKTAFFAGNERASHMYSYGIVNDNLPHRVEFTINGNVLIMRIDNWLPQKIENTGPKSVFEVEGKFGLYVGGIPATVAEQALAKFHVKSSESFKGCISDVFINGEFIDLEKGQQLTNIRRGCSQTVDLCHGVKCQSGGECAVNEKKEVGYECLCKSGFKGEFCEQKKVYCGKQRFLEYYREKTCRSVQKVKQGRCTGWCGNGRQCCHATKIKPKRIRLRCANGKTIVRRINIVRKCRCGFSSKCSHL
ncbi:unnamed protein product [Enterobius vermicularis]|uniref:Slit homolog 1 protein n=1 Tax=Enterobius vermicularis TaxID=51028 RepID=A0A158Q9X4_ENTVE|nr:unnamed protein product [Enterobius vermicularis]